MALAMLPEHIPLANVADPIVRSAIRYMSDRPELRLTAHDIAIACGCDERSLRRRFLRELDVTPVRFFAERRIEHGCMLLHFSQLSIDEIARDTGFCDRHHFTKAFKKARGVTPVAFRRISDGLSDRSR
jgi:transcriptional regulator GlxA family with amidase domain